ncbi:MAG: phosphotyrosine protein phosphatase [Flavobacteriales bacterium]|nr:phosphotyrosine protein phosphatase [Flavobacteriales bacterium]MCW8912240.1 phosphotyrosine protein phosphatase [Flavobacteriales bacterium]MCW8937521.1 phosphotyrosine protein phosphatase [Flavobacteriales bacterium]MCW8967154.1 phosphotyrosine protein phosphatase [Flavobacteriales bacterium]MCW8989144.1 phosphotyrosine protein phosphatase [Flavobacteriales bacterium]
MNILFVCSANKDRSKTAEDYFAIKYPKIEFDSAGINKKICDQLGTNYIDKEQVGWADKIYVMETKHKQAIRSIFGNDYSKKIVVLHIKDIYKYNDKELIKILEGKVKF